MPHETDESMLGYADDIVSWDPGIVPSNVLTGQDFLEWANEMFQDPANKDTWLTIANLFNAAAGYAPFTE